MLLLLLWLVSNVSNSIATDFEASHYTYSNYRVPRIVGGFKVKSRILYSFQASVRFKAVHVCGGTLIHSRFILTAAHCAFSEEKLLELDEFSIVVGDLTVYESDNSTIQRKVWRRHQHPRYFSTLIHNDIALLELKEPLETTSLVKPISISTSNPIPGMICKASGWGLTKEVETSLVATPDLMEIKVRILPFEECSSLFSWLSFDSSKICGYSEKGCPNLGDSGGPLVCDGHLSGVISFGKMFHCAKAANCFTSTHYHHKWIQYVISKSENTARNEDIFPLNLMDILVFGLKLVKSLPIFRSSTDE